MMLILIRLPALLPVLLLGSQVALAADAVPKLDISRSCRSAGVVAIVGNRNAAGCEQDENDAHATLEKEWNQFTPPDKTRCVHLSTLGAAASYVEMLTCLEMANAVNKLHAADQMNSGEPAKKSRRTK